MAEQREKQRKSGRTFGSPRLLACSALLAGWLLGALRPAQAQSPLPLQDALAAALAEHPALMAADAEVARRQGYAFQASRLPNPVAGYSASEVGIDGQAGQQGMYFSQQVRRGNKISLDTEIRQWDVQIACLQRDQTMLQIISQVRARYVEAAAAQYRLQLLSGLQTHLDRTVTISQGLVDSGDLDRAALLQAKLQAGLNQAQMERQRQQVAASRWRLAAAIGTPSLDQPVSTTVLFEPAPPLDRDSEWERVRGASPELAQVAARHQQSLWVVRREDVEPVPDLNSQVTVQHAAIAHDAIVGLQFGFQLPLLDRNRGNRNAARANTRRTHTQVQAAELQLQARLANALQGYEAARRQLQAIDERLLKLAEENLEVVEQAYSNGLSTYRDLISSQQYLVQTQLAALDARQEIALSRITIDTLLVPELPTPGP